MSLASPERGCPTLRGFRRVGGAPSVRSWARGCFHRLSSDRYSLPDSLPAGLPPTLAKNQEACPERSRRVGTLGGEGCRQKTGGGWATPPDKLGRHSVRLPILPDVCARPCAVWTYNDNCQPAVMETWKRILVKSLGIGVGIGVGLATSVGFYAWYASRPVAQKPWDASAITANFLSADTAGEDNHLRFLYILENHTGRDYRVRTSELLLSAVVQEKDGLTGRGHAKFQDDDIVVHP